MKGIGWMERLTEKALISTAMALIIMDRESTTIKKEKEWNAGLMGANTKDSTKKEGSMGGGSSHGLTSPYTQESSSKMICMGLGLTSGLMGGSIPESGIETQWKGKEYSHGWTGECTTGIISMIRKRALASSNGPMGGSTRGSEWKGSNMDEEPFRLHKGGREKECGRTGKD